MRAVKNNIPTGPEGRRECERVRRCNPSTALGDKCRGGVEGFRRLFPLPLRSLPVNTSMAGASGGVGFSELLDGELSVHILSLSLSDSSPLKLSFRLEGRVTKQLKDSVAEFLKSMQLSEQEYLVYESGAVRGWCHL